MPFATDSGKQAKFYVGLPAEPAVGDTIRLAARPSFYEEDPGLVAKTDVW